MIPRQTYERMDIVIFVTGDTHIPIDTAKLTAGRWPEQKLLSKDDYLIICGDFGGIWKGKKEDSHWIQWLNDKRWTTLFVDGNHENFDLLKNYPIMKWNGGKVHKIEDSIYHLMRGQVFSFNGIRIFTMGGASSHDKEYRKEGKSWWPDELPSKQEYDEASENLLENKNKVDFVITHCAPSSIVSKINNNYGYDELTDWLNYVKHNVKYKHWYFGHYHQDLNIDEHHTIVYQDIIQIV